MSTENHDETRPAAPQGSEPSTPAQSDAAPTPAAPEQSAPPRPAEQTAPVPPVQPTAPLPRPVQQVSAPTSSEHPQSQPTQDLHPQQHPTTPYPPQPAQPQRPQPQYGQYAPGHHAPQQPYGQQPPSYQYPGQYGQQGQHAQPRPGQYGQQQPYAGYRPAAQQPGQHQPGQHYADPYRHPASSPEQPGEPTTPSEKGERKHRGWVPVTTAAALAALLASGGTAGLIMALDDDSPQSVSMETIGDPGRVDAAPVGESTVTNPDWQAVTSAVSQSVVSIQVTTAQGGGEGSGLILDEDGHVLTNNHVVAGANDNVVTVTLADGRLFRADIVGLDPTTDLAVVKLQDAPSGLTPVALGDSDKVNVGDPVLAVGNPLGLANTATTGIVSALDRPVQASDGTQQNAVVTNAIQIDAAINPGNSGGPLFDASGRVIGITSSIATLSGGSIGGQSGSIGLGFAIPVNLAKNISDQLIEKGVAEHAFLGVTLQDATATADDVSRRGAQVMTVQAGSPAAGAGVREGDVIVAIDDQPVSSAASLTAFVRERRANEQVTLTLVRDGSAMKVPATLAVREETAQQQPENQQPAPGDDGSGQGDQGQPGQDGQNGSDDGGSLWDRLFPNSDR